MRLYGKGEKPSHPSISQISLQMNLATATIHCNHIQDISQDHQKNRDISQDHQKNNQVTNKIRRNNKVSLLFKPPNLEWLARIIIILNSFFPTSSFLFHSPLYPEYLDRYPMSTCWIEWTLSLYLNISLKRSSHHGSAVTNPTGIHEDEGSFAGLAQWVKDLALW